VALAGLAAIASSSATATSKEKFEMTRFVIASSKARTT
jgi:hypothetical protein